MKNIIYLLALFFSANIFSAMPVCYSTYGGYCNYTGKVSKIYINSTNTILIYFDTAMPIENAGEASISISNGTAAVYKVSDNPEFAKLFYSTALAAQASGRNISIQMRSSESGYLKFDRIWLNE